MLRFLEVLSQRQEMFGRFVHARPSWWPSFFGRSARGHCGGRRARYFSSFVCVDDACLACTLCHPSLLYRTALGVCRNQLHLVNVLSACVLEFVRHVRLSCIGIDCDTFPRGTSIMRAAIVRSLGRNLPLSENFFTSIFSPAGAVLIDGVDGPRGRRLGRVGHESVANKTSRSLPRASARRNARGCARARAPCARGVEKTSVILDVSA